jgi:hypothetical protein
VAEFRSTVLGGVMTIGCATSKTAKC